ncbi:cell wall hydrolase [Terribacillus halophilus]|jgi:N-acetylmuramoyl-L-alanine amidase|uniref:cell wall hydrolase n=1 Tax=Terribacillus halophilus TaxID=361279 RepID=UPI000985721F|nr:cell wall hydrolase [Terribacillus halophilus]
MQKLLSHSLLIFFVVSNLCLLLYLPMQNMKQGVYPAKVYADERLQPFLNEKNLHTVEGPASLVLSDQEKQKPELEEVTFKQKQYNAEDINLLQKLVQAETSGEDYPGKVAVATVVLNRIESEEFPDTIHDVIMQEGQFQPVMTGVIWKSEPTEETEQAVADALIQKDNMNNIVWFMNPKTATTNWIADTQEQVKQIGNHVFYR